MKRIYRLLSLLLMASTLSASHAQTINYLGWDQGLSNNNINAIYRDGFGFMWFGTYDGLNRFDGYSFKKFRNKIGDTTSLPDKEVYAIAEDGHRNLWIGTSKGAGILDNKTFRFSRIRYAIPGQSKTDTINQWIHDIQFDQKGVGYICSSMTGLLLMNKNSAIAVKIPLNEDVHRNYTVSSIAFDHHQSAWVLIDNVGLCRYDPVRHSLVSVQDIATNGNTLTIDKSDRLWIGTNIGLYLYNQQTAEFKHYQFSSNHLQSSRIFKLRFDKNDRLWIATDGEGITIADVMGTGSYYTLKHNGPGTLSTNVIHDIYFDAESRKWIGTWGGGINIIDERKNQFTSLVHDPNLKSSLLENTVHSICDDRYGNLWIGTAGGGLNVWNRRSNQFKTYVHVESDPNTIRNNGVASIIRDSSQQMLVGLYGGGVNRFDEKAGRFINIPFKQGDNSLKYISRLFVDSRNDIWAGCIMGRFASPSQSGLYKLDRKNQVFVESGYPVDKEIFAISENKKGDLFLGSLTKFFKVNRTTGKTEAFDIGTIVRSIYTDKNGLVWIGTYGKGLMVFDDQTGKFRTYNENNGLCNNTVLNIEEDDQQNIWVSTYNGLSRFNPRKVEFDNFYATDGLQSNQFYYNASAHLRSGELVFGGIKGLSYFKPSSIKKYNNFPNLIIAGIRISNDAVNADNGFIIGANNIYDVKTIRLPFDKAILSVDYVALEYSQPEKIKYAYFLEGWDKGWNYVDNLRNINYSRLNEGHYLLRIKSTNSSGVWNQKERSIAVIVLPPWYRTWYAYLVYISLVAGTIYFYLLYHKKQARLEYEVKLANLKTVQEKELNEKKIAFFTNISHELRAPLTLIVNPIKELLNNNGKNFELIDLSSVYRNTRRLLSMVDQLLLFRKAEEEIADLKPEYLNLKDICQEVFLCFNNQVRSREISYTFLCDEMDCFVFADREKIEIVLFNILSNAIKYTPDKGSVNMVLKRQQANITVSISDTGPGIPEEASDKLFDKFYRVPGKRESSRPGFGIGLFLAKKLVEINQGEIYFESIMQQGSTFYIILPERHQPESEYLQSTTEQNSADRMIYELLTDLNLEDDKTRVEANQHMEGLLGNLVTDRSSVLLIDDDTELRQYIKQLLLPKYLVYEADNAESGFEKVISAEPDIIVCDVVMQGLSGVDFCIKMKATPRLDHIPIILLTSSSSPEIKLKGIECGADDYITKPFESDLLLARINTILKGRQTLKTYFLNEITLKGNSVKVPEEYSQFLSKCIAIVEKHLDDEQFNVKVFTLEIGMSHTNLLGKIKSISGLTVNEFIRFIRLRKAAELMIKTDLQIKEIAYKVGFQQVRYFREQFYKVFEVNPSEFITKHRSAFSANFKVSDKFGQINK